MKNHTQLLNQTLQNIQTSSNATTTPAGQREYKHPTENQRTQNSAERDQAWSSEQQAALVEVVTHIFAQFELLFHNQYYSAFNTKDKEKMAKRLWMKYLKPYDPQAILEAGEQAIRNSEFLPSIHSVLKYISCENNIAVVRKAYLECCNAPSPKNTYAWSDPLIYWVGQACGWHFLATTNEQRGFDLFKANYLALSRERARGVSFSQPAQRAALQSPTAESKGAPVADAQSTLKTLKSMFK